MGECAASGARVMRRWHVFRRAVAVTPRDVARLRAKAHGKGGLIVFNPDEKRRQVPLRMRDAIVARVQTVLQSKGMLKTRQLRAPVALLSLPGCLQQAWHTDYDTNTMMQRACDRPMGVLLALQDGTKFEMPARTVNLGAGDLLVFDGGVVHAGAAYIHENVRMHMYLDCRGERRLRNRTYVVLGQD